jgi:anti-sigma factor RsiW
MTEHDLRSLEAIRARVSAIDATLAAVAKDVHTLTMAEAERRGREQATEQQQRRAETERAVRDSHQHDDRWQVWARAFLPIGALTSAWFALVNWLFGGQGQ